MLSCWRHNIESRHYMPDGTNIVHFTVVYNMNNSLPKYMLLLTYCRHCPLVVWHWKTSWSKSCIIFSILTSNCSTLMLTYLFWPCHKWMGNERSLARAFQCHIRKEERQPKDINGRCQRIFLEVYSMDVRAAVNLARTKVWMKRVVVIISIKFKDEEKGWE